MIAIARRRRTYVIRFIYALGLLSFFAYPVLVIMGYSSTRELDHRRLAVIAAQWFWGVMDGQALALVLLMPALVGGAIAAEAERGNLALWIASPMSSLDIVLGKLGPQMVQAILIVALSVPVLGLLSLNGGVDLGILFMCDAVMLGAAFLIACIAILVSTLSGHPRHAVLFAYVIVAAWLVAPAFADEVRPWLKPPLARVAVIFRDTIALTTGQSVMAELPVNAPFVVGDVARTILVQLGLGTLLVGSAAALLRPVSRRAGLFGWRFVPLVYLLSRRRLLPRPSCGTRPVLWKEMHLARSSLVARLFLSIVVAAVVAWLGIGATIKAVPAFQEVAAVGYGSTSPTVARDELNVLLRYTLVPLSIVWAIGLAVNTATSITTEKERQTWSNLIATPLSGAEIVGQKLLGAFWRTRWIGLLFFILMGLGVTAGAIHPLAGAVSAIQTGLFLFFVAGLGTRLSFASKSSLHALAWTTVLLFLTNGGYLFCCAFLGPSSAIAACVVAPLVLTICLATYREVEWLFGAPTGLLSIGFGSRQDVAVIIVLNLDLCGSVAIALLVVCLRGFEKSVDRPRGASAFHYIGPVDDQVDETASTV
jgi:ABC-type transport system involved in multi-copper enzyme maturation permease subunit